MAAVSITEQRQDLNEVLELLERGHGAEARALVQRLVQALDADQLVTTTQAAKLLRVRSVNTVKLLLKQEGATTVSRGNRTMVPLSEIERIQDSERLRAIRRSDQIHDGTEVLGAAKGLSGSQMADLSKSRPGTLPWTAGEQKPGSG
jgi:hypothetical protein